MATFDKREMREQNEKINDKRSWQSSGGYTSESRNEMNSDLGNVRWQFEREQKSVKMLRDFLPRTCPNSKAT